MMEPSEGHIAEGHSNPEGHVSPVRPGGHAFTIEGILLTGLLIIGSFVFVSYYARVLVETNQLAAVVSATLVDLTNDDRKDENLGTLKVNPVLVAAAQAKANDMAKNGYFAHTSPEGRDSWSWFREAGYTFSYAGENLAVNFSDSGDVAEAWMNSPSHRANILNWRFTEIGIATAVGEYQGKKTTFVVQMFGTPARAASARAPVAIADPAPSEEAGVPVETPAEEEVVDEPVLTTIEESGPELESFAAVEGEQATGLYSSTEAPRYASLLDYFASSPEALLRVIYIACALFIIAALVVATELEWKRHHARHAIAAIFLIALMSGLFFVADRLVFSEPVIGEGALLQSQG